MGNLLKTATNPSLPLDGSAVSTPERLVSDFLTIQSLTNFAVMTSAISTAWSALSVLNPQWFSRFLVPFVFAGLFGLVSILISLDSFSKDNSQRDWGMLAAAVFIAITNSLVLASAVVGANATVASLGGA